MTEQHGEKHADDALKAEIWKYTGKGILLGACFFSGMALGYILWGDACGRCDKVPALTADVSKARAETETVTAQWGQKYRGLEREKERLEEKLKQLEAQSGAAAGGA